MIAPALRLAGAVAAGNVLVGRPRSRVVHVYAGPLTPSGGFVPRSHRTVCRAATRRLAVLERGASLALDLAGRRVCRRCMPILPAALGRDDRRDLPGVDDWARAYANLTPALVQQAGRWSRTVAETHQVGTVASLLFGAKPRILDPRKPAPTVQRVGRLRPGTPAQQAVWLMHTAIETRRRQLVAAERTQAERDDLATRREAEQHDRDLIDRNRRDEATRIRIHDRRVRGQYLTPWERDRAS